MRMLDNEKLIKLVENDIDKLEDGYYYYFPDSAGGMSSNLLRLIADKLDAMNFEHDLQIKEYFEKEQQKCTCDNPSAISACPIHGLPKLIMTQIRT
jgi:hypothetical protein